MGKGNSTPLIDDDPSDWEIIGGHAVVRELPIRALTLGELTQSRMKLGDHRVLDDRGCSYADRFLGRKSKCVECPFASCFYETKGMPRVSGRREKQRQRHQLVVKLLEEGQSLRRVAEAVGLSVRSVRDIKEKLVCGKHQNRTGEEEQHS